MTFFYVVGGTLCAIAMLPMLCDVVAEVVNVFRKDKS